MALPVMNIGDVNAIYYPPHNSFRQNAFSTGLCTCSDTKLCCYGICCFPCLNADNSARMDGYDSPWCFCCHPGGSFKTRTQAKSLFGIQSSFCGDLCTVMLCGPCSEIQIHTELKGVDKNPQGPQRGVGNGGTPWYLPPTVQAMDGQPNPVKPNQWTSGLFDCCSDMGICFRGCCCHPCLSACNSASLDNSDACCGCLYPGGAWKSRQQVQSLRGIAPTSRCKECCISGLCAPCSDCQVARELKALNLQAMPGPTQQYMGAPPNGVTLTAAPQTF